MFRNVFKSGIRAIYNVSETPSFHSDYWEIYPAKHKQTGKVVSVHIFDKTSFENLVSKLCSNSPNTKNPRLITTECYELIRTGVSQLTKLKHPQILTVIEALEETKSKFLFVTEPVVGNLQTIGFDENNAAELQKGILEVAKGVQFLHNVCDTVHMNIQPNSIFVNSSGDWKLSSFYFLRTLQEITPRDRENYLIMDVTSVVPFANLNLNYVAPELILDTVGTGLAFANDVWSIGQLIFYLYNRGDCLLACFDNTSIFEYKQAFKKFEQRFYNHSASQLSYIFRSVPEQLWLTLMKILARYPADRLTIDQFIESDFFNGSLIKTMWFIDEFSTKSPEDKLIFLNGVLDNEALIKELPSTFKNNKLLPLMIETIFNELACTSSKTPSLTSNNLVSKALELVMVVGSDLSNLSFQDRIFGALLVDKSSKKNPASPLQSLVTYSISVRLVLVRKLSILHKKLNGKDLTTILKLLSTLCLTYVPNEVDSEKEQIELQDMFLGSLSTVVDSFDYLHIKNDLLPLICQVFKTTTILSTKLQTMETFRLFVNKNIIDEATIKDSILPVFQNLKSRDKRVVDSAINYFVDQTNSGIVKGFDSSVESSLSQCLRLAFGCDNCNRNEFIRFMDTIKAIQDTLVENRLKELPAERTPVNESQKPGTFDALINSASIKGGSRDSAEQVPRSKILQPNRNYAMSMNAEMQNLNTSLDIQHPSSMSHKFSQSDANQSTLGSRTANSAQSTIIPSTGRQELANRSRGPAKLPPGFSGAMLTPDVAKQNTKRNI
ncbi:hypothetical protein FT663_04654 [Candidozyma haemuli var. vulneris]|nr:hypothetical protein FT662_04797 [[Candida] haemuloni var. vulneris]KAF3986965.1 hypothetical protein FT663_04654 [[Candida] haemuloni var. vulneris]